MTNIAVKLIFTLKGEDMKAEIVENTKGFKPVSIQLTFQTKSELAAWLLMTNERTIIKDNISYQLANNPEFEEYEPMSVDFRDLTTGDIWQELREHLDKFK